MKKIVLLKLILLYSINSFCQESDIGHLSQLLSNQFPADGLMTELNSIRDSMIIDTIDTFEEYLIDYSITKMKTTEYDQIIRGLSEIVLKYVPDSTKNNITNLNLMEIIGAVAENDQSNLIAEMEEFQNDWVISFQKSIVGEFYTKDMNSYIKDIDLECFKFKKGRFFIETETDTIHIVRNENIQQELYRGKLEEFEIHWMDNCNYKLTNKDETQIIEIKIIQVEKDKYEFIKKDSNGEFEYGVIKMKNDM